MEIQLLCPILEKCNEDSLRNIHIQACSGVNYSKCIDFKRYLIDKYIISEENKINCKQLITKNESQSDLIIANINNLSRYDPDEASRLLLYLNKNDSYSNIEKY